MKKSLYAIAWVSLLAINNVNAAITPDTRPVDPNIRTAGSAEVVIQRWVWNVMGLLFIIAVLYWLWGGFNILTAGWDEEKVKNGKTVIINSLLWLVVIYVVGTVVELLLKTILT